MTNDRAKPWRDCDTCRSIYRDRRERPIPLPDYARISDWACLADVAPREALLVADMATLHAIHHEPIRDPVIRAGMRELVGYFNQTLADMVPATEANHRVAQLGVQLHAEMDEVRRTADADARASYEGDLREAQTRLLIVEALRHAAGTRKTMRTEDVRQALSWVRGDKVPEFAKEYYREMFVARRGAA